MAVEATREIRAARVLDVTTAIAHDDHYLAVFPTEPYASRGNVIRAHQLFEQARDRGMTATEPPAMARIRVTSTPRACSWTPKRGHPRCVRHEPAETDGMRTLPRKPDTTSPGPQN